MTKYSHLKNIVFSGDVSTFIKENAQTLMFVLVWNLFEDECMKKSARIKDVENFVKNLSENINENTFDISLYEYFRNRYLDKDLKDALNLEEKYCKQIEKAFKKHVTDIDLHSKIKCCLYICFRFRNNLFHGEKDVFNTEQECNFELINEFLMQFIEIQYKSNKKREDNA